MPIKKVDENVTQTKNIATDIYAMAKNTDLNVRQLKEDFNKVMGETCL